MYYYLVIIRLEESQFEYSFTHQNKNVDIIQACPLFFYFFYLFYNYVIPILF